MAVPKAWKNKYRGQDCFILGNGPSLLKHDVSALEDKHTVGCNAIYKRVVPDFLCVSDPSVLKRHAKAYKGLKTNLVISSPPCPKPGFKVYSVPLNKGVMVGSIPRFDPNMARTHWGTTVVLDLCLPLAVYLGFSRIFLLGCDCESTGHFYRQRRTNVSQAAWHTIFGYFRHVRALCRKVGIRVFNAGVGGNLRVFPRVLYEDALKGDVGKVIPPPKALRQRKRVMPAYKPPRVKIKVVDSVLAMRNQLLGQRCFILHPSTSLRHIDLDRVADEVTIACGDVSKLGISWSPTYYVGVGDRVQKLMPVIRKLKSVKLIDRRFAKALKAHPLNVSNELKFSGRAAEMVYDWGEAMTPAIQVAFYLGAKRVYLVGTDGVAAQNAPMWLNARRMAREMFERGTMQVVDATPVHRTFPLKQLDFTKLTQVVLIGGPR